MQYILVFFISIQFNLYFLVHMKSIPEKFHFVSLKMAASTGAMVSQMVLRLVLQEYPIPQFVHLVYVIIGGVNLITLRHFYLKQRQQELQIEKQIQLTKN